LRVALTPPIDEPISRGKEVIEMARKKSTAKNAAAPASKPKKAKKHPAASALRQHNRPSKKKA
jgi:hypothetical protein